MIQHNFYCLSCKKPFETDTTDKKVKNKEVFCIYCKSKVYVRITDHREKKSLNQKFQTLEKYCTALMVKNKRNLFYLRLEHNIVEALKKHVTKEQFMDCYKLAKDLTIKKHRDDYDELVLLGKVPKTLK